MRRWLAVSIAATVAAAGLSLYLWQFQSARLPERLPIHWDIHGQVDGTAPRDTVLLLVPAIMAGWVVLTLLLPWLSPRQFQVEPFRGTYDYCMALLNLFFAYIHFATVLGFLLAPQKVTTLVLSGIFLLFALLGNVLGKVRRNFWIGIRTPWTLADDRVWNQTHRLGAWLFVLAGVVGFVGVLVGVPFPLLFVGFMLAVLWPVVYSLILYKRLERAGKLSAPPPPPEPVETTAPQP
jgi:uncharacterized membrane protein